MSGERGDQPETPMERLVFAALTELGQWTEAVRAIVEIYDNPEEADEVALVYRVNRLRELLERADRLAREGYAHAGLIPPPQTPPRPA